MFEEIMAQDSPNLKKDVNIQTQEAQSTPKKDKPKETHTKTNCNHAAAKQDKERMLKAARKQ